MHERHPLRNLLAPFAFALALAACGSSKPAPTTSAQATQAPTATTQTSSSTTSTTPKTAKRGAKRHSATKAKAHESHASAAKKTTKKTATTKTSTTKTTAAKTKTTTTKTTTKAKPKPAVAAGVSVDLRSTKLGMILVGPTGRTLYLFAKDKGTSSTCYGGCASVWPPLTTTGAPRAGSGVKASLLGTTKRKDGTSEVTYAGHPLYYYAGDTSPGQTTGQGLNQFGAPWYVVSSSGSAITSS